MRIIPVTSLLALSLSLPAHAALPNGVAAGDVSQSSAWLWARSDTLGLVKFEVASDTAFNSIVGSFNAAVIDAMQPVKGVVTGLAPGQQYYYRATDATLTTATGSFRTAAAPGTHAGLRFGVTGDWRGELAPYPAIANVAARNLDFLVKHGDTIYAERYSGPAQPTASTLAEYRARHDEVLSSRYGVNSWATARPSSPASTTTKSSTILPAACRRWAAASTTTPRATVMGSRPSANTCRSPTVFTAAPARRVSTASPTSTGRSCSARMR